MPSSELPHRGRWVALAVIVVVVAGSLGFWWWRQNQTEYSGKSGAPKVLIIGDSITVQSEKEIEFAFEPNYRVRIEAQNGQRSDQMQPRLEQGLEDPAGRPHAVVINLGTNDGLQRTQKALANYLRVVQTSGGAPCLVLTTVNALADDPQGDGAENLNAFMKELARQRPNVRVADWSKLASGNKDLVSALDGIHPTPKGKQVLAQLYIDAVKSCPASGAS